MIKSILPALLLGLLSATAQAAPENMKASGGCSSATAGKLGDAPLQFCMTPGSFGDDSYELKSNGQSVLTADVEGAAKGVTGTVAGQSVTLKCTSELKSEDGEDTEVGRMCDISGPAGVVLQVHIDLSLMHPKAS